MKSLVVKEESLTIKINNQGLIVRYLFYCQWSIISILFFFYKII
ncbi:hypothetical protein AA637_10910 [Cyanobacterium sp. HL-69]|nr:hypothetical protein AA637_10910 [Cyanobacterium sp. HL-69]